MQPNAEVEENRGDIARAYATQGEYPEAAFTGLSRAIKLDHQPSIAESKIVIGHALAMRGRSRDALPFLIEAKTAVSQLGPTEVLPNYHSALEIALGVVYDDRAEYDKARECHLRAESVSKSLGDAFGNQRATLNLGYVHYKLGKLEESVTYMVKALRHPHRHPVLVGGAHEHLADILAHQGQWQLALEHRQKALRIMNGLDTLRGSRIRCGMAQALLALGREDEAWEQLVEARELVRHIKDPIREHALAHLVFGRLLLERERHEEAFEMTQAAELVCESCGSAQYMSDVLLLRARLHLAQRDYMLFDALVEQLRNRVMSFHRTQELHSLREQSFRLRGNWEQAYRLGSELNRSHIVDVRTVIQSREALYRSEMFHQHNHDLMEKNHELSQVGDERNELLNIIVQDLSGAMSKAGSAAEMLEHQLLSNTTQPAGHDDQIDQIKQAVETIGTSVRTLRQLIEVNPAGMVAVDARLRRPAPVIERAVEEYRAMAARKSQKLVLQNECPEVMGELDDESLRQALGCMLSNAIKFSYPGSTTRIVVSLLGPTRLGISVADQGLGLNADDLRDAFRKFSRMSSRPTGGERSHGLGLYILRKLVERMGGEVWASSKGKGQGATFIMSLPVQAGCVTDAGDGEPVEG